eukprot:3066101-Pleurochrysis_carterae.AAC.1
MCVLTHYTHAQRTYTQHNARGWRRRACWPEESAVRPVLCVGVKGPEQSLRHAVQPLRSGVERLSNEALGLATQCQLKSVDPHAHSSKSFARAPSCPRGFPQALPPAVARSSMHPSLSCHRLSSDLIDLSSSTKRCCNRRDAVADADDDTAAAAADADAESVCDGAGAHRSTCQGRKRQQAEFSDSPKGLTPPPRERVHSRSSLYKHALARLSICFFLQTTPFLRSSL